MTSHITPITDITRFIIARMITVLSELDAFDEK